MLTYLDLDTYRNEPIYADNSSNTSSPYDGVNEQQNSPNERHIMNSPSSSSMSPMSTSSDSNTCQTFHNLSLNNYHNNIRSQQSAIPEIVGSNDVPMLHIVEQPVEKFRFRYKSEMHGTHGSLMGNTSVKNKRTFPTVELRGYDKEAIIRCSLYQTDTLKRSQHSHRLVVRNGDQDRDDPHDVIVSPERGLTAIYQGMGIIHTAKKYINDELFKKRILEKQVELGRGLSTREESKIKLLADQEARTMNLNQVCLCFQAYRVENNKWIKLCETFSNPINNMKSALTGELKISRLSTICSSASGGDDLIILVEKVGKKNIKVKFYELDEFDKEVWTAWGIFTEVDVHHQYAIALRTPPYKDRDITEAVDVYIQLFRPSDQDQSEPMSFKYKPRNYLVSRKRARMSSSLSSGELPSTIVNRNLTNCSDQNEMRISQEYNASDLLREFQSKDVTDFDIPSSDFDAYYKNTSGEYVNMLNLGGTLEADSPSVIKRGPGAPPMVVLAPTTEDFKNVFNNIVTAHRSFGLSEPAKAREMIRGYFKQSNERNEDNILQWAIRNGDFKIITTLLKFLDRLKIEDLLQYQNLKKETALHVTCVHDKPEFIRALINLGADPNIPDKNGNTPLHVSVELGFLMCATKIMEKANYTTEKSKELKIDLINDQGMTPLHLAVRKNNLNMVKKLLDNGSSVKLAESKHGYNVLHIAVEEKAKDIVLFLLENTSIKVNGKNTSGHAPLHLACAMELKEIIEILLDHNADPLVQSGNKSDKTDTNETDEIESDESDNDLDPEPPANDSFDLAEKNPEILQMLNAASKRRYHSESNDEEKSKIDEGSTKDNSTEDNPLFDEICEEKLNKIFSENNNWVNVANKLELRSMINVFENSNPSKTLLYCIKNNKISIDKLGQAFLQIGLKEAVLAIDEMESRKMECDEDDDEEDY